MAHQLGSDNIETYLALSRLYLGAGQPERALKGYRRILDEFGVAEAERVGVAADLQELITRGVHVSQAKAILTTYWHDEDRNSH